MISQTFLWRRHTYSQHVLIHEKELNITDHEFSSVQMLSCVQLLRPNEPQHVRPPCPSPTPRVHPNWCPSWWCHPIIWFPVIPFSSCPQSFPASGSFPKSQLFTWGGQNTGASALASFLPKNTQRWSPLEWTGWISLQSKTLSRVFSNSLLRSSKASIFQISAFFTVQLSHPVHDYWENHSLD